MARLTRAGQTDTLRTRRLSHCRAVIASISMPSEYLKRAVKTPDTETDAARKVAGAMLADIERRGEAAVREYAEKLDQWTGDIVVTPDEVERRTEGIAGSIKRVTVSSFLARSVKARLTSIAAARTRRSLE